MTKVIDKKLLQLGIKASSGDIDAEKELKAYVCQKFNLHTQEQLNDALRYVEAPLEETTTEPEIQPLAAEPTTEPEPEPPQEAV